MQGFSAEKQAVVRKAIVDTAAFLVGEKYELTPNQALVVEQRLTRALPSLYENLAGDELDLMTCATLLDIVDGVLHLPPPRDIEMTCRELALAGGDAVARLHAAGGYKQPTRAQAEEIARVLTLRAAALTERGVDREAAMDDMRDTAARVVGVVLGDAPSRINLN